MKDLTTYASADDFDYLELLDFERQERVATSRHEGRRRESVWERHIAASRRLAVPPVRW